MFIYFFLCNLCNTAKDAQNSMKMLIKSAPNDTNNMIGINF